MYNRHVQSNSGTFLQPRDQKPQVHWRITAEEPGHFNADDFNLDAAA